MNMGPVRQRLRPRRIIARRRKQLALQRRIVELVGTGQVMPITAARRMYSPTAVRPIPSDWAITRSLVPQAYL